MPKDLTTTYREFYSHYSALYGPETCVLMLVGKFYELYDVRNVKTGQPYTPIKRCCEIMNIVLKEKDGGFLEAGVPEQSLHKFAQTLTREGWTVVVVDQVKDKSEQVVDRIATRVLSPGTHIEVAGQERMSVASLWITGSGYATSVLDLTTGETFSFYTKAADDLIHMFQVYCVREIVWCSLVPMDEMGVRAALSFRGILLPVKVESQSVFDNSFRREEYFRKLFRIRGVLPVREQLFLTTLPVLERSLCLLLRYVEDHFPQQAERLTSHQLYCPDHHMRLSNNILEQLNMITFNKQRSVLNLLERTHSSLGRRTLRERILRPITDEEELNLRWTQVQYAKEQPQQRLQILERHMKSLYDIPRLHFKISEGKLEAAEVLQLFQSYSASACLIKNLMDSPLACPPELETQIDSFRKEFNTLFDEEKAAARVKEELTGYLTPIAGPRTCALEVKMATLMSDWRSLWNSFCFDCQVPPEGFKLVSKGSGEEEWAWEGPRAAGRLLAGKKTVSSKLTNFTVDTRKSGPITISCKEFEELTAKLRNTWATLLKTQKEEMLQACDSLWSTLSSFTQGWANWLGMVDTSFALASVATENGWCRPSLGEGLVLEGLRHPLLETAATRMEYVKHDVALGDTKPGGWLIYGVNASGKSSLMKAVGISILLAQAGSFVPATSMTLRPYDAAFSRIWTQDNVWAGLSSFAVEVAELREVLAGATSRSLVLGDEVCSGTESGSATALVAAVLEHLDSLGAHFLFATHLHDLLKVKGLLPRAGISVWHLRVDRGKDGKLLYDRRLQPGAGSCSYGLEVARAMGLPLTLMNRAYHIRREMEGEAAITEAPVSSWNAAIQRQMCEMCGHPVVKDLEVHHLRPRAEGGGNELRNLAVLCESCHDKHHNGELEVPALILTSDGLERSTMASSEEQESVAAGGAEPKKTKTTRSKKSWDEEQEKVIHDVLQKHHGRPVKRILAALEESGISMTPSQLKTAQVLVTKLEC